MLSSILLKIAWYFFKVMWRSLKDYMKFFQKCVKFSLNLNEILHKIAKYSKNCQILPKVTWNSLKKEQPERKKIFRPNEDWDAAWWGDSPRVSAEHKFKCISKCWDAGWVDSLPMFRGITSGLWSYCRFQLAMPVSSPPCPEQKRCEVNDGVV